MTDSELLTRIQTLCPEAKPREKADRLAVQVPSELWTGSASSLALQLRDAADLRFDLLMDHTAIDWMAQNQMELIYELHSTALNHSIFVSVMLPRENATIASVAGVWPIAEWQEREVYDLLGVNYVGHPDLRRLFLEDDWQGHPLRKDYKDSFMLERPW